MYLAGLNLGGFFSQVKDDIFTDNHLDNFIKEADFEQIKKWGFNSVRLPIDYFFFEREPFKYDESRLKRIDNVIAVTGKYGLKTVIDLHKSAGHSFDFREKSGNDIWDKKSENRKRFLAVWNMLSRRYSDHEKVIYELLNEPVAPDAEDVNELYEEAVDIIRKNDKEHCIMIESNLWGTCRQFPFLKKLNDDKIIYSFHFYEPVIVTHQLAPWMAYMIFDIYKKTVPYPGRPEGISAVLSKIREKDDKLAEMLENNDKYWDGTELEKLLQPVLNFKNKYNVPIYCGEFGIIVLADPASRKNWMRDFMGILKKHSISFGYWSYKNMDFGVVDHTEEYRNNPNYGADRVDHNILNALISGIKKN